ncbi:YukJ family protein [Chlorobium sp. BLA1]|uniref:YukJ family protein n=1 Tax=Candidatus Chlorobium masyuteum TaxID=2716876 RepID=UPI001423B510|nr:YukJ family protein [Candidatus Chlorobium masyuteum]NHQ59972.1 YukJ family protein [Candidatus Chlorobium masyuteum]NTU44817.1 YukJ family protein [Chlorobiaceae bacterium]
MALFDGYGVLVGTLYKYYCDHPFSRRKYYHCNLKVQAGKRVFRCPVDLDSKRDAHGIQWRVIELLPQAFDSLLRLPDGWHPLDSEPGSGALDYYRTPELQPTCACISATHTSGATEKKSPEPECSLCEAWKYGTGFAAFRDLEPLLMHARKLFIFGEPFRTGNGVHNIHQNQGDSPQSQWYAENGAWQDGAVVVLRRDHTLAAFLCKFNTQSFFPSSSTAPESIALQSHAL